MSEQKEPKEKKKDIISLALLPGQLEWLDSNKPRTQNRTQFIQSLIDKAIQEKKEGKLP